MRNLRSTTLLWLAIGILLLGVSIRIIDVMLIPYFSDEAWHLIRAHRILNGVPFAGFDQNKWFYGYVVSWFNPTGPEGPWIARYVNILWAAISMSAAVAVGRKLDRRTTGLVAGLVYAVVPLATFHERQALTDPQVAALAAVAVLFAISLARPDRKRSVWYYAAGLGIVMALARATKPSILPFYALPIWGLLLFALPADRFSLKPLFANWRRLIKPTVAALVAVVFVLAVERAIFIVADSTGVNPREQTEVSADNTLLAYLGDPVALQERLTQDITFLADAIVRYVGIGGTLLMVSGLVLAFIFKDRWREVLFILAPAILFMAVPVVATPPTATGEIATRYTLINTVSLSVLVALGLSLVVTRVSQYSPTLAPAISLFALIVVVGQSMWFNVRMLQNPWQVNWNRYDQRVYFEDTTSGYYHIPVVNRLHAEWINNGGQRQHTIGPPKTMLWVQSYMGPRVGDSKAILYDSPEQQYQIALWLEQGEYVYLIESPEENPFEAGPNGTELEYLTEWDSLYGQERLHRVIGAREGLAAEVYDLLGDEPEFMQADYEALAASLAEQNIEQVIAYPYDHAPILNALTDVRVEALPVSAWPLTAEIVTEAVESLDFDPNAPYAVIVYDPPVSDPERVIPMALAAQDYLVGNEQWTGLLRLQHYIDGEVNAAEPVNAVFEGVITLKTAAVSNSGGMVEVEARWQTAEPVQDSFVVFTHILDADGNLVAQRDGIPGGGLFPLTEWEPGETITDRYVVQLPADLPAGEYDILIGLYEPTSQLRLRVTDGSPNPDFVPIATFAHRP